MPEEEGDGDAGIAAVVVGFRRRFHPVLPRPALPTVVLVWSLDGLALEGVGGVSQFLPSLYFLYRKPYIIRIEWELTIFRLYYYEDKFQIDASSTIVWMSCVALRTQGIAGGQQPQKQEPA